mmetsp:Transcript_11755/g.17849  ORF Transcript_11755/g.17849 Transcript_11755/m.17849 type:complete len:595 (+) Transcript_11755:45-1829(+)
MKVINQSTMKLMSVLGLMSIPYNTAEPNLNGANSSNKFNGNDCSLHVGEKHDNSDGRHRRMVSANLLPERCEESEIVSVDIPHDGTKRAFKKVKSKSRKQKEEENNKNKSFGYWYGEDGTDGSTFNYVQDEDGNIHGSLIDISSHSVMQFSVEDGIPTVTITDSSDFRPEIDPPNEDEDIEDRNLLSDTTLESTVGVHQPGRSYLRMKNSPLKKQNQDQQGSRALYDDSGANLDVMVVWTKKAECKNYGLAEDCDLSDQTKAAMEAKINLAIDETNTAFALSGADTQLYLAHSYRHSTFVETSITESLNALRNGEISGTEQNRATYGADIVAMILDDANFCGQAFLGPRIDKMYSVTAWNCATGYFSFGHEIGHNLGLRHDRGTENDCENTKFQFGYRDPQARFRTILAYDCIANQCDNNAGGECTRIQRFSSPSILWGEENLPVGTAESDNVRKINNVKSKVALYFPHGGTGGVTTTSAPTSAPTAFPSHSPSTSTLSCNDSPLEFSYQDQFITCADVASSQNLCSDTEIQAICPGTCGTCSNCVDPTLTLNYFNPSKGKWQTKGCDVIAQHPSVRCEFDGVSDTCRATCGTC